MKNKLQKFFDILENYGEIYISSGSIIVDLKAIWQNSCPLRFISYWNLTKGTIVSQFEKAKIEVD